jgi:predicted alpha/beta hydrolase
MPAMGVRADFYQPFARQLAEAGWHVVTADLRGVGQSSARVKDGARFGYREMLELDWPANLEQVRRHFPGLPVYLLGHSLGGQLNALYTGLHPEAVAGLIMISCGSVYFRGWRFPASLKILSLTQVARCITEVVGYLPGKQIGFGGTEAKGVIRDWAHLARTGRFRVAGSTVDYESRMRAFSKPVLALSFSDDDFAPQAATENLLQKLPRASVRHLHVQPGELGAKAIGHYGWVKNNQTVVKHITDWLDCQSPEA